MGGCLKAKYSVGQVIHHRLFDYRGVIVDVDPYFSHTENWYQILGESQPNKEQPWYHILVNDSHYITYVAEANLELDPIGAPITHPQLDDYFDGCEKGAYRLKKRSN